MKLELNDIVKTKKKHPCGNDLWSVIFLGSDIKLKCEKCEHIIMMPRDKTIKAIKEKTNVT